MKFCGSGFDVRAPKLTLVAINQIQIMIFGCAVTKPISRRKEPHGQSIR